MITQVVTRRHGFSLVELTLIIVMAGILMTMAVPKTSTTVENTHVNQGVAGMRSLWLAQRRYHLKNGDFAPSIKTLVKEGYAQKVFLEKKEPFQFEVKARSHGRLRISATRSGSSSWRGTITLDEMGKLSGSVTDGGGHQVKP